MRVSKHANKRIHERINVPKSAIDKLATKALEEGITHKEATGQLSKYLDKLFLTHTNNAKMRVYNQKVFIFSSEDTLITVIDLPTNLKKVAEKIKSRRNKTNSN